MEAEVLDRAALDPLLRLRLSHHVAVPPLGRPLLGPADRRPRLGRVLRLQVDRPAVAVRRRRRLRAGRLQRGPDECLRRGVDRRRLLRPGSARRIQRSHRGARGAVGDECASGMMAC